MNPLLKISSGVIATSGVSSTVVYQLTNPFEEDDEEQENQKKKEKEDRSFRKRLREIGRTPAESDEDWSKIQELYDQDYWNEPIPNLPKVSVKNDINLVIKWCEKKLKKNWVPWDMDLVESWCAAPISIAERVSSFPLQDLDTWLDPENRDNEIWKSKVKNYPISDSTLRIKKTVGPDFEWKVVGSDLESVNRKQLMTWCRWAKLQPFQHEKADLFEKYKFWCTKPRPPKPDPRIVPFDEPRLSYAS
ncbi:hypothetical protein MHF_0716 [Mycoplasma haemofelis Ohio2]|uniref:Uncharacterized protein n=1 Tax=Mycoplasma haemofelis (strain Ohio2) TaxID=859194 RepID=F6FID8_MYCHI|nr:hypothetical protein MHF_0716 [Mycoplasma haemofelis Ohio2]